MWRSVEPCYDTHNKRSRCRCCISRRCFILTGRKMLSSSECKTWRSVKHGTSTRTCNNHIHKDDFWSSLLYGFYVSSLYSHRFPFKQMFQMFSYFIIGKFFGILCWTRHVWNLNPIIMQTFIHNVPINILATTSSPMSQGLILFPIGRQSSPDFMRPTLDFNCGVGRITCPLHRSLHNILNDFLKQCSFKCLEESICKSWIHYLARFHKYNFIWYNT